MIIELLPVLKLPEILRVLPPPAVQLPENDWHWSVPMVNELATVTTTHPVTGLVGVKCSVRLFAAP